MVKKTGLEPPVVIDFKRNYSLKNNCRNDILRWLFLVPGSVWFGFHSDVLQGKGSCILQQGLGGRPQWSLGLCVHNRA